MYTRETQFFFVSRRAESGFYSLKNGDIVSAKILSVKAGGFARIFFNGSIFEGRISGNLKEGDALKMRVVIEGGRVLLVPESENLGETRRSETVFSKLGLPKNELTSAVLSFLTSSASRLEEGHINKLLAFLKDIKKDKAKAVFAGGLLESKGIEPDEAVFNRVYALIFGDEDEAGSRQKKDKPDGGAFAYADADRAGGRSAQKDSERSDSFDAEDLALFEMLNHTRSNGMHWIVIPFKKDFSVAGNKTYEKTAASNLEKKITGSLSLLLDLNLKTCRNIVLRCKVQNEAWLFSIKDKVCTFMQEGAAFSEKEKAALQELLSVCLAENGAAGIGVKYGRQPLDEDELLPLDVRV